MEKINQKKQSKENFDDNETHNLIEANKKAFADLFSYNYKNRADKSGKKIEK